MMKKVITIRISGGLGNQMFEYAFAYCLAKRLGVELRLDLSNYYDGAFRSLGLQYFQLEPYKTLSMRMGKSFLNKVYRRVRIGLNTTIIHEDAVMSESLRGPGYYLGVYADYAYFKDSEADIRRQFKRNFDYSREAMVWSERIHDLNNVVSVHIRRGDYVSVNRSTLSMEYFENAIIKMKELRGNDTVFLFFCEDIAWVKNWFGNKPEYLYMQGEGIGDIEEFFLISECNAHINADSTFSWWAAFLNEKPGKTVIIPDGETDYASMSPKDWIPIKAHDVNVDEDKRYL